MRWSWRIARIAGIDVRVHATLGLLVAWLVLRDVESPAAIARGMALVAVLFGVIVLHELGHALAARRYGIRTLDITLLPVGGVARLERQPQRPREELVVAAAGPAVNFALALVAWLGLVLVEHAGWGGTRALAWLAGVNLTLGVFNLAPAFPLDGGRMLRALLSLRHSRMRATLLAARIGQGLALLLGIAGVVMGPSLLFVAVVVWVGAEAEARGAVAESLLRGVRVRSAMLTDFHVLSPDVPLVAALELAHATSQEGFPVVDGDRVVGLLQREDLVRGVALRWHEARVRDLMQHDPVVALVDEPLSDALARQAAAGARVLPVVDGGALVGLLTVEHAGEVIALDAATHRHAPPEVRPIAH